MEQVPKDIRSVLPSPRPGIAHPVRQHTKELSVINNTNKALNYYWNSINEFTLLLILFVMRGGLESSGGLYPAGETIEQNYTTFTAFVKNSVRGTRAIERFL